MSHEIIEAILPLLIAGLTAVCALAANWINKKVKESQLTEKSGWYATAMNLAGVAVKMAETKFGPDTARGQQKKAEAVQFLKERLYAMDKNVKISDASIASFVDAAYHDVFVAVSPLANGAASNPLQTA